MTADVAQACADLTAWLHPIRELITQPDTQPVPGHDKPASKPPWNTAAANLAFDIKGGLIDIEQQLLHDITGRPAHLCRRRPGIWTEQRTIRVLQSISRLAEAAQPEHVSEALRQINAWITAAMQLPAVDLEERWRQLPGPCPRCSRHMLRASVDGKSPDGRVACLGCSSRGQMRPGTVSDGYVEWDDGEIT